jgi:hypothetical protein
MDVDKKGITPEPENPLITLYLGVSVITTKIIISLPGLSRVGLE